jgi:hypothetical protein
VQGRQRQPWPVHGSRAVKREIVVSDVGHAYAADPGDLWFSGQVTSGPRAILGNRASVHLTEQSAVRLATELLTIVFARRARLGQSVDELDEPGARP